VHAGQQVCTFTVSGFTYFTCTLAPSSSKKSIYSYSMPRPYHTLSFLSVWWPTMQWQTLTCSGNWNYLPLSNTERDSALQEKQQSASSEKQDLTIPWLCYSQLSIRLSSTNQFHQLRFPAIPTAIQLQVSDLPKLEWKPLTALHTTLNTQAADMCTTLIWWTRSIKLLTVAT